MSTPSAGEFDKRALGLANLKGPREVALMLFARPSELPAAEFRTAKDFCVGYSLDDARPLEGRLAIAPYACPHSLVVPGQKYQRTVMFTYPGLTDAPDMRVDVVLSHGDVGEWPPGSVMSVCSWF